MKKFLFTIAFTVLLGTSISQAATRVDLSGSGWTFEPTLAVKPVPVSVPHSWPVMAEYRNYLGVATYERDFDAPSVSPGQVVRLHFGAVYVHASVWLNGHHLGTHDGGYTPFEFEVTGLLKPGRNHLLVEVNNIPTLDGIPAMATAVISKVRDERPIGDARDQTIVGWMPYGGIVRPVCLLISDAMYLRNAKIDSEPNLLRHTAHVIVHVWMHNGGQKSGTVQLQGILAGMNIAFSEVEIPANSDGETTWEGEIRDVHLWSVQDPYLYDAAIKIPGDEIATHFGVRELRVENGQLLLNGRPVHLFGANRVSEDEKEGLSESDAIIERDMSDMLADNMRMMRIAHYPQAQALLDFADRHGMLIIAEAGNWNMSAWQMADPGVRARWQHDMHEMMEQDWNHPSVIAWSMGNEYESYTREGVEWTRDMRSYTLAVDSTRLITFASRFTSDPSVKSGADEASQYSDFVSINAYRNYAQAFDRAHELYPNKPIFVTEFGIQSDGGMHDTGRIANITEAVEAMKARPWMIGGALWSWADYRSLYRNTPASGIRYWGVVTLDRKHRDSWEVVRKFFNVELP